jgi:poly(3-hydroxybutyrate) depolymerase
MLDYLLYEQNNAALAPVHAASGAMRSFCKNPLNPLSYTFYGRALAAGCEVFEHYTRRRGRPGFNITSIIAGGKLIPVREKIVWQRPFCRVRHFEPLGPHPHRDQKLLIVAPLSGHYATLLRGTVKAMLPNHSVYITDWSNARDVPLTEGSNSMIASHIS